MNKLFKVGGVSKTKGQYKVRFATDLYILIQTEATIF